VSSCPKTAAHRFCDGHYYEVGNYGHFGALPAAEPVIAINRAGPQIKMTRAREDLRN
jgi:hypothetical protein